ncbi:MAG: hypothetical protein ABR961_02870 [Thermoanaerobaculaceae bacterium]
MKRGVGVFTRRLGPLLAVCAAVTGFAGVALTGSRAGVSPTPRGAPVPRVGFTVHWDFLASADDAERLVSFAIENGAEILNVVPPPHIWEDPASLAILKRIFAQAAARGVGVVLNRIDGSSLPGVGGDRRNWLYSNVLTERGRLPSGRPTPDFFLSTVGKPEYERWLREETAFYADAFSSEPALLAFGVGLFNEPFVSQRGSLLCFDASTDSYEIAQYTPSVADLWRRSLAQRFGGIAGVNSRYRTRFKALDVVPMPLNENDPSFGDASAAYFDFVSTINAWVVRQIDECRALWRTRARRGVPFMLQFSGYVPEKLEKGRAAFAALDIFDWMTRVDALGLSAYTNCEYPDLGHASVVAMVDFLRLGPLLGTPVWVLEGGSECDGAVLDRDELRFFATVAAPLRPASVIYEFLKMSYAEHFSTSAGKMMSVAGVPRPPAVAAVREALQRAKASVPAGSTTYVLDDLTALPEDAELLAARKRLARLAVTRPMTFVPPRALSALPRGATLVVPSRAEIFAWRERLAAQGVTVAGPETVFEPLQR